MSEATKDRLRALLSRKFLLAVFAIASATTLIAFELVSEGVYSTIVLASLGVFTGGNVLQKTAGKETKS